MRGFIDTSKVKEFAIELQRVNKSAIPVTIRQTLNKAAYDVKQVTMPESSAAPFIHRMATFFKANSKVTQAEGFNISSMKSVVGFIPKTDVKDTSVTDLEQQESGGQIKGRSFIPLAQDRVNSSWQRNVKAAGRYRGFAGKIYDSKDAPAKSSKLQYLQSAIDAAKVGGLVIGNRLTSKGNKIAWQVQHINRFGGNTYVVATPLFAVEANRSVKPPATHFMQKASNISAAKMEGYFIELANKKIKP